MYKRVLLAYDGSESGQQALLNCREIAQWSHSELFLVAIMPPPISIAVEGVDGGPVADVRAAIDARESREAVPIHLR